MAGRGAGALLLVLLVSVQLAAQAESKSASSASSSSSSALCSKFPSFCEQMEHVAEDKKGKGAHQRFAETKWRKPKGDSEIRGHLAPKKPLKQEEVDLDDASAMRAATIREAEERVRVTQGGAPGAATFDKKRTVEDARRKAHLIQEARRKRRQRLEKQDSEEDDEDEMVVEVEEEEEEQEEEDEAVVEDDSEEDDDEEDSEEISEEEQQEEEEYVEDTPEVQKKEEEEEEEEEEKSEEVIGKYDDEPEDEEDRRAQKKLKEVVLRRRKWKEEEARMKKREEERKRVDEEKRKKDEEVRKKRIEEVRKKKRHEEEERRKEEDEEERRREEAEEEERRKQEEEELRRKKEKEDAIRKQREEKEKEERRRQIEEKEREEKRRRDEEARKRKEDEEKRKLEQEKLRKLKEQEEERERIEEEKRRKLLEEERVRIELEEEGRKKDEARKELEKREAEEKERKRKEIERKRREEEEARKRAEVEERERKMKAEAEEKERKIKAEEEERERRKREEQEIARKKKEEQEIERKQKEEQEMERKKKEEQERKRKEAEEIDRLKKHEEAENKRKKEAEKQKKESEKKLKEENLKASEKLGKKPKDDEVDDEREKTRAKEEEDDDQDQTSWMSGFPEFFAPTADDDVKNEECKKHSRIFVQHLAKYKTWALNMYDATAKLPSGILSGNAIQLGDFDECLGVEVRLRQRSAAAGPAASDEGSEDAAIVAKAVSWLADLLRPVLQPVLGQDQEAGLVHIRGRYCLAGVDLDLRPGVAKSEPALKAALDRTLAFTFIRGSLNDSSHFVPRFRTLHWGVCVPESCSARDVEQALRGAVARFQRSGAWGAGLLRARVAVPPNGCRVAPRERPLHRLPPTFFLVCGAGALLLLLAVVATIKDSGHEPDELGGVSGLVASFSLRRNWSALTAPDDPGAVDIRCIHGIRSVCCLLLYCGHKVLVISSVPFSNRSHLSLMASTPGSMLLRGSIVYTDTFLLLSGALASFHLSRQLSRNGGLEWASRFATRVIRLTPTLGIVTVVYAYVLEHIGTGPMWGQLVEENGRICRENMWRNLLYVSNLWPFEQMCAPHTHHLAVDMQLSLLVPPLVWLLVKAWPLASPVIVALIGTSTYLRQHAALEHRVSLLLYNGFRPADMYRAADTSYIQPPHRATAYLTGVALGYLLHRVPRKLQIPKALVVLGWLACGGLAVWALFSQRHAARFDYKFDVEEAARFTAFAPLAWAGAMSWLIFACHTNNGGWMDRVLCARPLVLLGRISYAFYLIQFPIFFYNAGSVRSQKEFSFTAALDLWELLLAIGLSILVTLLVEMPMQSVRSAFSTSHRRQSLKWEPPTPAPSSPVSTTAPQADFSDFAELAAAYYYNPGISDIYASPDTSHPKEE